MNLATYTELVKDIPGGKECIDSVTSKKMCSVILSNETGESRLALVADHDPENWLVSYSTEDENALANILQFALDFELPLKVEC